MGRKWRIRRSIAIACFLSANDQQIARTRLERPTPRLLQDRKKTEPSPRLVEVRTAGRRVNRQDREGEVPLRPKVSEPPRHRDDDGVGDEIRT